MIIGEVTIQGFKFSLMIQGITFSIVCLQFRYFHFKRYSDMNNIIGQWACFVIRRDIVFGLDYERKLLLQE